MQANRVIRLPPLPSVRDLVRLYRLRAIKQLSQNFLLDERITDKIVHSAGKIHGSSICEVGPGPGSITRSIIKAGAKHLIVVEKDARFLPSLELLAEASCSQAKMEIVIGDILSYNLENTFNTEEKRDWLDILPNVHLIGNLPFNIASPLLIKWLHAISERKSAWMNGRVDMTLTFQKEVAERIVAPIAHKQRCRLSVMCQLWCWVEHKFTIPGKAFIPKPDVDVGVVKLIPLKHPFVDLPFKMVEKVVRNVFNMRQKYSLRGGETLFPLHMRVDLTPKLFELANVDPTARPFEISTEEFARLCYAYKALIDEQPDIEHYDFRACKKNLQLIL